MVTARGEFEGSRLDWGVALARLDALIGAAEEAGEVHRAVVEEARMLSGAQAAGLALLDGSGEWVRTVAAVGYEPDVLGRFERFRADADVPLAEAIRTARPLVLDPSRADGRYETFREAAVAAGRTAAACLPLLIDGRAIGAIGLSFGPGSGLDVADLDAWGVFAERCAAGLARVLVPEDPARLHQMLTVARGRLAFMSAAGRELVRSLDRDAVLATLTRLVVPRFADWASVLLVEGDELVAATLVHRDQPDPHGQNRAGRFRWPTAAETAAGRAYRSDEPVRAWGVDEEVQARIEAYPELADLLGSTTSRLVLPMTVGERVLGLLTLAECHRGALDDEDVAVMAELASRAGTALEHATRFEAEHDMVETLQRAILPDGLLQPPGMELTARYLPAAAGTMVGGDWYDAFELRDGRVGLCIGDIAGHGVAAAACMAQLRNALRVYALDGDDTSTVMARLNAFAIDTEVTAFTTLLYLAVDPRTSVMDWTSAGHLPPLVARHSGPLWLPGRHGPPLGVVPGQRYGSSSAVLEPGDLLVLYTDGLVERRDEAIDDGLDRLARTVGTSSSGDLDALADELITTVRLPRRDDICVLLTRRRPDA